MQIPTNFPHLREIEKGILIRYLSTVPNDFSATIDFRFPIQDQHVPDYLSGSDRDMWIALHQKRVEAVLENASEIRVVEVKDRLVPSAIGELLTYRELGKSVFNPSKKLRLLCVFQQDDVQLHAGFQSSGIELVQI